MIAGVGINDVASYTKRNKNPLVAKAVSVYTYMIVRCYSKRYQEKHPSYIGCTVCEKWKKLSGFLEDLPHIKGYAKWVKSVLAGEKKRVFLDKDGLFPGNKVYSKDTCQFLSIEDSTRETNTRNCKNKTGQFSEEAIKKRMASTDFTRFREKQLVFAMSYAKKIAVSYDGIEIISPSIHACARLIGCAKTSVKYALEKGIPLRGKYYVRYADKDELAMKQTCIICDRCRSRLYGVGYSTTWSKARRRGWTHPDGNHRRHLCPMCSAEEAGQKEEDHAR